MRVRHVMTKNPSCCVPSDPAPRAAGIMRNEDTGIIPVIENEQSQKIVGVVTDRDLCMNIVAEGRDSRTVSVDACMTTAVVTCSPNDAVERATGGGPASAWSPGGRVRQLSLRRPRTRPPAP
jgi:CBS domain-containing protein